MKLKKGDKVMVIAGKNRGESGIIVRAFPKERFIFRKNWWISPR